VEVPAGAPGASRVAATVDGESVPVAALDIPYAVDPGAHVVTAKVADGGTTSQEVTVNEGEEREVVLTLSSEGLPRPLPPPREAPPVTARAPSSDRRTFAWIAFGTAGVAALLGGAAGIASWTRESSVSARCNRDQCPPSTYGDIDTARAAATASTVSFVVAGVAAVAGVVSVLTAPSAAARTPGPAAFGTSPSVRIGPAGLAGTF
jgi:hypothetical protein